MNLALMVEAAPEVNARIAGFHVQAHRLVASEHRLRQAPFRR
jgi:hypothetical protein